MPQKVAIWLLVLNMGCGTVGTTIISPALSSITEQFGVDEPICGLIMTPGLLREGDLVDSNNYCQLAIEPEFVITLKQDLAKVPTSDRALLDAIEFVQPGIELHNYVYHFSPLKQQEVICSNGIHAAQLVGNNKVRASEVHWQLEGIAVFKNGELVASGVAAEPARAAAQ